MKLARSPVWHRFWLGAVQLQFSYQLGNQDIARHSLHKSSSIWSHNPILPHSVSPQTSNAIIVSLRQTGGTLITKSSFIIKQCSWWSMQSQLFSLFAENLSLGKFSSSQSQSTSISWSSFISMFGWLVDSAGMFGKPLSC